MGTLLLSGLGGAVAGDPLHRPAKSINTYYTDVIVGALLLLAVYFDRIRGGDSYE